jgi:hypothetical protein
MPRSNPSHPSSPRTGEVRIMTGVIAAGLLLGGVATALLYSAGDVIAPRFADAQASTAAGTTAKPRAARSVAKPAAQAAPAKSAATASAAKPAGKTSVAMPGAVVQSSEHLDDQVAYQYNALGRRDPFQPLMGGEYVGADVGGDAPPDVGGIKVVGIVWGDADQFALVEDARGDSHILRRGDKVMNGYVESLNRNAMVVNLTLDGQSQSVTVPLTRKGGKANANR